MTQQQTRSDDRATGATGAPGDEARSTHRANARVEQLRGGLEKAVTGREHVIKARALKLAEQLDERTRGRHHNKIHVALRVVELIVDNVSGAKGGDRADASARANSTDRRGVGVDAPEDLGEFRNLSDKAGRETS